MCVHGVKAIRALVVRLPQTRRDHLALYLR